MGKTTDISWADSTWNPWIGCSKISAGCANCYSEALMDLRYGRVKWGKGQPRSRTSPANWKQPLKWNRDAALVDWIGENTIPESKPRVFCASLADWLDDEVPIEWLADLLRLIHGTPNLDWLLLTKRPENWLKRMIKACDSIVPFSMPREVAQWIVDWRDGKPPANVWIGTTVENQAMADLRIPQLLRIPARIRFLSVEPMLEQINLGMYQWEQTINWVIVGGESGPKARRFDPEWAEDIRRQCAFSEVAFFMKQCGQASNPKTFRDFNSFPEALRLRQFPA